MSEDLIAKIYSSPEYRLPIKNTILSFCPKISDEDLNDCIEEVYLIAITEKVRLESHPNIEGWLVLTAKYVCKRFLSRHFINKKYIVCDYDSLADSSKYDNNIPLAEEIENKLNFEENIKKISELLTKSEYELFNYKFIEGYSHKKISAVMRISPNYVKIKINRLIKKLKKFIQDDNLFPNFTDI